MTAVPLGHCTRQTGWETNGQSDDDDSTSERARVGWAPAAGWRAAVCSCAVVGWQIVGAASGPTSAAVPAGESLARGPPKQGKLRDGSFLPADGLGFSFVFLPLSFFKGCEA